MILCSIRLSAWRSFLEACTVGPFSEGLNVIHAPNGTGKSTLFEALRLGLLDRHRTSGAEVRSLAPWGRPLAPQVTLEFKHDGTQYRITKQFLSGPSVQLERMEQGRYRPLANGDAADDTVREMLLGSAPGRGLTTARHWGLAQVLWAPQGHMPLEALSDDTDNVLRGLLGGQATDLAAAPLEQRIEDAYRALYTPGGVLKTGKNAPALVVAQQALAESEAALAEARAQHTAFEEQSRLVEDARAARLEAQASAEAAGVQLQALQERLATWQQLDNERQRYVAEAEAARTRHAALKQQQESLAALAREIADVQAALTTLEAETPARARELEARQQAAAKALAMLEDTRRGRAAVDAAEQEARDATTYQTTRAEHARLMHQVAALEAATADFELQRAERGRLAAPAAKELRQFREALRQRDEARLHIQAASIEVEWVPETDGAIHVLEGESPGALPVRAGVPAIVRGLPRVSIEVPGQGRLRASGPAVEVKALRQAQQQAEAAIALIQEKYGTSDPDELAQRQERAAALDQAIAQAQARVEALLGEEANIAGVQRLLAQAVARQAALQTQYPAWVDAPPDVGAVEAATLKTRNTFVAAVTEAELARDRTEAARGSAQQEAETHARRVEETRARLLRLTRQRDDAAQQYADPEALAKALAETMLTWEAAKHRVEAITARMPADSQVLPVDLERLQVSYRSLMDAAKQAHDKEQRALALLEQLAGKGTYSKLAALEEQAAGLAADVARAQRHAEAIRRLRDTVEACRSDLRAQVYRPVEARASALMERMAGPRLGSIALGTAFEPRGVHPILAEDTVALDALSGGEQEQLYLAVRLALAQELARDARQLVVLDDVLTATDSARLRRIHALLEEAAAQLQIVVLTCHPERYRGLTAEWFDLEAIQHGAIQ